MNLFSVRFPLLPAPKSVRPALTLSHSLSFKSVPSCGLTLSSLFSLSGLGACGIWHANSEYVRLPPPRVSVIQPSAKRLICPSPLLALLDRRSQLGPAERCWWGIPSRRLRKVHLDPVGRKDHLGHHPGRFVLSSFSSIFVGLRPALTDATFPFAECPTCPYVGLDLSAGLFSAFASHDVGVSE